MTEKKFYLPLLFSISFLSVALGALDSVLSSAYLPDILRDMNSKPDEASAANAGAWINFSFLAGGAVGGIIFSFISDRFGRRKTLALALLFYGAGSGLGAFTHSWQLLSVTRFLVGIGVGTALVISAVIISEAWGNRTKAIALGMLSVAYPAGIIASGIITSSVSNWRNAFFIGAIPVLFTVPVYYLVKETLTISPIASEEKKELLSAYRGNLISGILIYGTMLIGLWSAFSWLPTWVQSLLGDDSAKGQSQRGMSVTLLGLGGLIGSIASGWLVNRWGARLMQAICFILCLLFSFLLFKLSKTFSIQILVGSGLLGICFGVSQGVLNAFIPELFPISLRSSATGLCFHTGRVFTAIAVFFIGAWAVWLGGYGNAIFAFSGVYIIGLVALLFMKQHN